MKMHMRWIDNQPGIRPYAEKLIEEGILSDLYCLVKSYDLQSGGINVKRSDLFTLHVSKNDESYNFGFVGEVNRVDSTGEIYFDNDIDYHDYIGELPDVEKKELEFLDPNKIDWAFEDRSTEEEKRLVNSNLSNDLQSLLEKHSLTDISARIGTRFLYHCLTVRAPLGDYVIQSDYVDFSKNPMIQRSIGGKKAK